jgi:hypothetical protein
MVVVIFENGIFAKVIRSDEEEVIGFDVITKEIKPLPVRVSAEHDKAVQDIYYGLEVLANDLKERE